MSVYVCSVCETRYDEDEKSVRWNDLPADFHCPVCDAGKPFWRRIDAEPDISEDSLEATGNRVISFDPDKAEDTHESYMADIHAMATTGKSIIEPMQSRKPVISWDDILIQGAQLAKIPLNHSEAVDATTVIGPNSAKPLVISTPIYISHMSFGALSKEAKTALARGSRAMKTAIGSGEGGILPESRDNAYKYIFEYIPNRYSVTDKNLRRADAIEIKFGQSAKPGMGGHLPGNKVTSEIAAIRGFAEGTDIISPAHYEDILDKDQLKKKVSWLREVSEGRPIGIKFAAGHIEADLEVALYAEPDFITIDGRSGGTGASPKYVKDSVGIPTPFAIYRARKFLDEQNASHITLVCVGGLRVSSDFAKALALGADAVAISTSAMMAIGCQQYRICNTGNCPMGIATQDPELRALFDVDKSADMLHNFLKVSTEELKNFARLTGKSRIKDLSIKDLCTTSSEISNHTQIRHV